MQIWWDMYHRIISAVNSKVALFYIILPCQNSPGSLLCRFANWESVSGCKLVRRLSKFERFTLFWPTRKIWTHMVFRNWWVSLLQIVELFVEICWHVSQGKAVGLFQYLGLADMQATLIQRVSKPHLCCIHVEAGMACNRREWSTIIQWMSSIYTVT